MLRSLISRKVIIVGHKSKKTKEPTILGFLPEHQAIQGSSEVKEIVEQLMKSSISTPVTLKLTRKPACNELRFSPYAWAKFLYFRDKGSTEISGFGISTAENLLSIVDFITVKQSCTAVSIKLDDVSVSDFFVDQTNLGRQPCQYSRVWLHTHPGSSASPSGTDISTLNEVFGDTDFSVMAILALGGATYARIRFNGALNLEFEIPIKIDYSLPFPASNKEAWDLEYTANVSAEAYTVRTYETYKPSTDNWHRRDWKEDYKKYNLKDLHEEDMESRSTHRENLMRGLGYGAWGWDDEDDRPTGYSRQESLIRQFSQVPVKPEGKVPLDSLVEQSKTRKSHPVGIVGSVDKKEEDRILGLNTDAEPIILDSLVEQSETRKSYLVGDDKLPIIEDEFLFYSLADELDSYDPKIQLEILKDAHMSPSEINDYVCFYDEQGRLHIELDPEQFDILPTEAGTPVDPFTKVITIPKEPLDEI